MKKLIAATFASIILVGCAGMQQAKEKDLISLKEVKKVKMTKDQIYKKTLVWVDTSYLNTKKRNQKNYPEQKIVTYQGIMHSPLLDIRYQAYKVIIMSKKNTYQILLIPTYGIDNGGEKTIVRKMMISAYREKFKEISASFNERMNDGF